MANIWLQLSSIYSIHISGTYLTFLMKYEKSNMTFSFKILVNILHWNGHVMVSSHLKTLSLKNAVPLAT